jgi:hypothetical protein
VEQLVHEGRTNPEMMYGALRENNLIFEGELQEMKAKHPSESMKFLYPAPVGLGLG